MCVCVCVCPCLCVCVCVCVLKTRVCMCARVLGGRWAGVLAPVVVARPVETRISSICDLFEPLFIRTLPYHGLLTAVAGRSRRSLRMTRCAD